MPPIVEITSGRVRGGERPGSLAFLGIPFATPVRFQAPGPVQPWTGVRDATAYGPTAQRRPFGDVTTIPEPSIAGEQTLNVNVFTPSVDGRLPVLVWIHGGGYFAGSPASPWYDGRSFNRDGVVTVTLSYRLGFDGFGWIDGVPGNRGVLDQIAALRWVRENIAAFGGDPERVTIAGQSAGGGSVLTLMSSPLTAGLFHGAIAQSSALTDLRPDEAATTTSQLVAALGINVDDLGAVTEDQILDAQREVQKAGMPAGPAPIADIVASMRDGVTGLAFAPVVDGETVLSFPDAMSTGPHRATPLLLGTTADEFSFPSPPVDAAEVTELLLAAGASGTGIGRFLAGTAVLGPSFLRSAVLALGMVRVPAMRIVGSRAATAPTWTYDFRHRSGVSGAAVHCLEIPFVFDLLDAEGVTAVLGAEPPQRLADEVHADWVRFVTSGHLSWTDAAAEPAGAKVYADPAAYDPDAYHLEWELATAEI
ncbi:carboxylic ester hydrolase [Actinoplanes sp. OR16]|uniref:carboxylesterase/lipase family protein n=1 Tax=Actinoplanes sp. OR16 TaxID=946334 RepID=UPI000F6F71EF|nr:carboxylesterase family protein [Actinoplanes sp. OR16]BBH67897.1 carboxylic ester hydrolase [Actinoplanes sp. OR16]